MGTDKFTVYIKIINEGNGQIHNLSLTGITLPELAGILEVLNMLEVAQIKVDKIEAYKDVED